MAFSLCEITMRPANEESEIRISLATRVLHCGTFSPSGIRKSPQVNGHFDEISLEIRLVHK
jgi:hypothetical protein